MVLLVERIIGYLNETKQTQTVVVISGTESDYVQTISRVPQGIVQGPLMFLMISAKTSHQPFVCLQITALYIGQSKQ